MFKLFPNYGLRNISLYYLLAVFSNGWFILANWVFYFQRYLTNFEIGIIDLIGFLIAFILEIPSGAIADLLGKKRTIVLAYTMQLIGVSFMTLSDFKYGIVFGNTVFLSGLAFLSGSLEAIAYDSMVESKVQKFYDNVISKFQSLTIATLVFATLTGGFLFGLNIRYPWYLWLIWIFIALIFSLFLKEPRVDTFTFSFKQYFLHLKQGFNLLLSPALINFFIIFAITQGVYKTWSEGFLRIIMGDSFNYNGESLSYAIAVINLVAILVMSQFVTIKKFTGDKKGVIMLPFVLGISFIASFFVTDVITGFFILLTITLVERIGSLYSSTIINKKIDSKYRATTLSTLAMITVLPYILIVVPAGYLTDQGQIKYMFLFLGFIPILIGLKYLRWFFK